MVPKLLVFILLVVLASAAPRSQSRSQDNQPSTSSIHGHGCQNHNTTVAIDTIQRTQTNGSKKSSRPVQPPSQENQTNNAGRTLPVVGQSDTLDSAARQASAVRQNTASGKNSGRQQPSSKIARLKA